MSKETTVAAPQNEVSVKKNSAITDSVLAKVNAFQQNGELLLPKDYSPENALKSAYLMLIEQVDRDKRPVLESCSKESIANALLDMVVQGLSPLKKQCYFIPYGGKLQLSRSVYGTVAVAKRVGGLVGNPVARVIYEGDVLDYEIIPETGLIKINSHSQKFGNIDLSKIIGAYAIGTMQDGTKIVEIMTMAQIKKSWEQGATKGNSGAHNNFTDEMCKKTVINRLCKTFINTSDDGNVIDENEVIYDTPKQRVDDEIEAKANKSEFVYATEVEQVTLPQAKKQVEVTEMPEPVAKVDAKQLDLMSHINAEGGEDEMPEFGK
jgi:recombination protein RecT